VCNANEKTSKAKVQIERWIDRVSKRSNINPQAQVGTYEHAIGIKSHVKHDVRKRMVMQFVLNVFLKLIYSLFYKLHERENTNHHIQGLTHQPQMALKGE
jgi:hypothetical protein